MFSFSVRRPRRLKGFGIGRWGVETGREGSAVPLTAATTGLPAAASRIAICACEMGSFGEPSYRSTERGTTLRRFRSLPELSKMDGLKRPCAC